MFSTLRHQGRTTDGGLLPGASAGLILLLVGAGLVGCAAGPDPRLLAALTVRYHPAPDYRWIRHTALDHLE